MSLYNVIAVILLAVVIVVGTLLKVILKKQRKDFEKFHGYKKTNDNVFEKNPTDDWDLL